MASLRGCTAPPQSLRVGEVVEYEPQVATVHDGRIDVDGLSPNHPWFSVVSPRLSLCWCRQPWREGGDGCSKRRAGAARSVDRCTSCSQGSRALHPRLRHACLSRAGNVCGSGNGAIDDDNPPAAIGVSPQITGVGGREPLRVSNRVFI